MIRIGFGWDSHRLEEKRPLILGGVAIPYQRGLAGHSDADVLVHAIIDALLGSLALGNIGQHFPDTSPQYKDADSVQLLRDTMAMVREAGYVLSNLDATVVAEAPKLNPHLEAMRENLARPLGVHVEDISIKAKTGERVGPEGRGEAISAHAAVLVRRQDE